MAPVVRAEPAPTESVRLVAEPVILVTGLRGVRDPYGQSVAGAHEDPRWPTDRELRASPPRCCPCITARRRATCPLLLGELAPIAVIHLGLADGRSRLALERVALNVMDYRIPDNAGYRAEGEPCVPEGPAAYFATLPLPEILAALTAGGIPAYVSNTAGTFLCNQTLYATLHEIAMRELTARAGSSTCPSCPPWSPRAGSTSRAWIFPSCSREWRPPSGSSPRTSPRDASMLS